MLTQFVSLQLSRQELLEIHAALVSRIMVEDDIRRERGQEAVDQRPILERIEMLLGETDEALHALDHVIEDELWEHAWYTFTDEWAWFRAKQEIEKESTVGEKITPEAMQKLVATRYRKSFDRYVGEVNMIEGGKKKQMSRKQVKGK